MDGYALFINHDDHPPPHLHVRGNGIHCRFTCADGELLEPCALPRSVQKRLRPWIAQHRLELLELWQRAQRHQSLGQIPSPG